MYVSPRKDRGETLGTGSRGGTREDRYKGLPLSTKSKRGRKRKPETEVHHDREEVPTPVQEPRETTTYAGQHGEAELVTTRVRWERRSMLEEEQIGGQAAREGIPRGHYNQETYNTGTDNIYQSNQELYYNAGNNKDYQPNHQTYYKDDKVALE